MAVFRKFKGPNIKYSHRDPQKALPYPERRHFTCLLCQSEWLIQLGPADRLLQAEGQSQKMRVKKDSKEAGQQIFTHLLCKHLSQCCISCRWSQEFKKWRNDIRQRHGICLKSVRLMIWSMKGLRSRWMSAKFAHSVLVSESHLRL